MKGLCFCMPKSTPIDPQLKAEIASKIRNDGMTASAASAYYGVNAKSIHYWLRDGVVDGNRNLILENNKLKNAITEHALLGTAGFAGQSAPLYVWDEKANSSILASRQQKTYNGFHHVFTSENITESSIVSNKTSEISSQFPLFVLHDEYGRRANFDMAKLEQLFSEVEQPDSSAKKVYPEDIFDYIYASLHSPSYREKYNEFLKANFPRVPRPASWDHFWRHVELGRQLRELHLMRGVTPADSPLAGDGDGKVTKVTWQPNATGSVPNAMGSVYINETQYFDNVPELAWNFYIGGYQPAQKWLKDRVFSKFGRPLDYKDVEHYQRIITILIETDRLMKQIG